MERNNTNSGCPKVAPLVLDGDYNDCSTRAEQISPADLVPALTESQKNNLAENQGMNNDGHTNCEDLNGLLCDIRQDLEAVLVNNALTIFANDFSKCSDSDENPTLASMWSRIYRYSQAVTAILCTYDAFLAKLLKSGKYPQVLMGSPSTDSGESSSEGPCKKTGYPVWVNPDEYPTNSSRRPVTSDGVYRAVQDAMLSVWHRWEAYPTVQYYAHGYSKGNNPLNSYTDMKEGDIALVAQNDSSQINVIYKYTSGAWTVVKALGLTGVENFAVTHVEKGFYSGNGVYYFDENGKPTWNLLDATLTDLEVKMERVEDQVARAVVSADTTSFLITTRANLSAANSVAATSGKTTLVFITG